MVRVYKLLVSSGDWPVMINVDQQLATHRQWNTRSWRSARLGISAGRARWVPRRPALTTAVPVVAAVDTMRRPNTATPESQRPAVVACNLLDQASSRRPTVFRIVHDALRRSGGSRGGQGPCRVHSKNSTPIWPPTTAVITSCVAAGYGGHGMPPPPCKNPTSQLYSWAWQLTAHAPLAYHTKFEVRRPFRSEDMTHFRSQHYVGLVTLTFVFDLETAAHYYPWGGQNSYQFWFF